MTTADIVVIGGGPAGLAAATALATARTTRGAGVVVIEREGEAGGIPRHSDHQGYGLRDLHRSLRGPEYAREWIRRAEAAGVDIRVASTVTELVDRSVTVVSGAGVEQIAAGAVILATGCRERPRSARLIAGDRGEGVMTTGTLQQLVRNGERAGGVIGHRAVIVGAEHVSFSAVLTLRHVGCATVALVTDRPRHQSFPLAPRLAARGSRLITDRRVVSIAGRRRVSGVELDDGSHLECDTVIVTGDWIADHELAVRSGVVVDHRSSGPSVDGALRTSVPGVFAIGNLVHPVETADVCTIDGRAVVDPTSDWLNTQAWPEASISVMTEHPLRWVQPARLIAGQVPPRQRMLLRTAIELPRAPIVVRQGDRQLWTGRLRGSGLPSRTAWIDGHWISRVDPTGGPILIAVVAGATGRRASD
jgi:thioredoxin reductase